MKPESNSSSLLPTSYMNELRYPKFGQLSYPVVGRERFGAWGIHIPKQYSIFNGEPVGATTWVSQPSNSKIHGQSRWKFLSLDRGVCGRVLNLFIVGEFVAPCEWKSCGTYGQLMTKHAKHALIAMVKPKHAIIIMPTLVQLVIHTIHPYIHTQEYLHHIR